jgi:hypothetical protein
MLNKRLGASMYEEYFKRIEEIITKEGYVLKKKLADLICQEYVELSTDTANDAIEDWNKQKVDDLTINDLKKPEKGFGFIKDKATNFKKKHNVNLNIAGNEVIFYIDEYFGHNFVLDIKKLIAINKYDLAIDLLQKNRHYNVLELKELFNLFKIEDLKVNFKKNKFNIFNLLNLLNVILKVIESELNFYKEDKLKSFGDYKENMVDVISSFYKGYLNNFDLIIISENPFLFKYNNIKEECSNYLKNYGPIKWDPFEKSKNRTKESKKLFLLETKKQELYHKFKEFEDKKYLFLEIRKKIISILNLFEEKEMLLNNFKKEVYELTLYEDNLIKAESDLKKYCDKNKINYPIFNSSIYKDNIDLINYMNKYDKCSIEYRNLFNLIIKCYKENSLNFLFNSKEFIVTKERLMFKFSDNKGVVNFLLTL